MYYFECVKNCFIDKEIDYCERELNRNSVRELGEGNIKSLYPLVSPIQKIAALVYPSFDLKLNHWGFLS